MIHSKLRHLYPDVSNLNERSFHIILHDDIYACDSYTVSYVYPIINSAYSYYIDKACPPNTRKLQVRTLHFCTAIGMSEEDKLIWFLKFGEFLPRRLIDGVLCHN